MPNCSRIYASLRSVLDMCHRHIAPSKGQNFSCRQACVEVPAFFPLVLCKQWLDLFKQPAVRLDLILISNHTYGPRLQNCFCDRCKSTDIFHGCV